MLGAGSWGCRAAAELWPGSRSSGLCDRCYSRQLGIWEGARGTPGWWVWEGSPEEVLAELNLTEDKDEQVPGGKTRHLMSKMTVARCESSIETASHLHVCVWTGWRNSPGSASWRAGSCLGDLAVQTRCTCPPPPPVRGRPNQLAPILPFFD